MEKAMEFIGQISRMLTTSEAIAAMGGETDETRERYDPLGNDETLDALILKAREILAD
jgi:hypothetical protein